MPPLTRVATAAAVLETCFTSREVVCRHCATGWEEPVARVVNVSTDPDARLGILLGTMHQAACRACATVQTLDVIVDYYDPVRALLVQIRPAWERAAGGEAWYWERLEALILQYQELPVRVDVVFGFGELIERHLGGAMAVAEAREEWAARQRQADSQATRDMHERSV